MRVRIWTVKGSTIVKSFALFCMILGLSFAISGCTKTTSELMQENMSEFASVYYYGEGDNFHVSISSGERESTYLLNGKSEDCVDFALVSLFFDDAPSGSLVKATILVDGQESEVELEVGGVNSAYMVDLETLLSGEEEIVFTYSGQTVTLENLSKNFQIDAQQAVEIGANELESEILKNKTSTALNCEGYLKVLDKKSNGLDYVFWCFSIVNTDGESYSVIISTEDGSILAKTN